MVCCEIRRGDGAVGAQDISNIVRCGFPVLKMLLSSTFPAPQTRGLLFLLTLTKQIFLGSILTCPRKPYKCVGFQAATPRSTILYKAHKSYVTTCNPVNAECVSGLLHNAVINHLGYDIKPGCRYACSLYYRSHDCR